MKRILNCIYYTSVGFIIGLILDFIISKNLYLDMRIKSYIPFYMCLFIGFIYGFLSKKNIKIWLFYFLELVLCAMLAYTNSFELLSYIFRDAILLPMDIEEINVFLVMLFVILNILCSIIYIRREREEVRT